MSLYQTDQRKNEPSDMDSKRPETTDEGTAIFCSYLDNRKCVFSNAVKEALLAVLSTSMIITVVILCGSFWKKKSSFCHGFHIVHRISTCVECFF